MSEPKKKPKKNSAWRIAELEARVRSRRGPMIKRELILRYQSSNSFYVDVSKRLSTCHLCAKPIPKGSDRLAISLPLHGSLNSRNGGKIFRSKQFYHTTCMASWIFGGKYPERQHLRPEILRCYDCNKPFSKENTSFSGKISVVHNPVRLCGECVDKRWIGCRHCGYFVPKYQAERIISGEGTGQHICRSCLITEKRYGEEFRTPSMQKTYERELRELAREVDGIKERYARPDS